MGLLDDAIREHLELKRRRGADPAEVAREEHDALGPVRREPLGGEAAESVAPALGAVADAPPPPDPGSAVHDAPPPPDLGDDESPPLVAEPAVDPEPTALLERSPAEEEPLVAPVDPAAEEPEAPFAGEDLEPDEEDRLPPHGDELEEALPHEHAAPPDATEEFTLGERLEAEGEGDAAPEGEDDVLEETPDFLQETPEHDRLWFEQKPPRDFDFDG